MQRREGGNPQETDGWSALLGDMDFYKPSNKFKKCSNLEERREKLLRILYFEALL